MPENNIQIEDFIDSYIDKIIPELEKNINDNTKYIHNEKPDKITIID